MTKLKIVIPSIHKSRLRQIARTGHEIYYFENKTMEEGYNKIFDKFTKELTNIQPITKEIFEDSPSKYDMIMLPQHSAMWEYSTYSSINKAYIWTNVCDIDENVKTYIANNPVMIATSNNWKLRPQDRTVTIGIDPEEFPERDYDIRPASRILAPINNLVHVGKKFAKRHRNAPDWFKGFKNTEYFKQLVGYDWVNTLTNNDYIKICGRNPQLEMDTLITREQYKKWLRIYSSVLIPSRWKHHANATAEAMMSKQAVLIRPSVLFRVNPTPLIDNYNCYMIKSEEELTRYYCNDGWVSDRRRQQRVAENALLTAHQYFSMKTCVERWKEFFEHVEAWH